MLVSSRIGENFVVDEDNFVNDINAVSSVNLDVYLCCKLWKNNTM